MVPFTIPRKVSLWKELKGVDGLPDFRVQKISKMVDLGGKIAVLWEEYEYTQYCKEVRIWCAEVSLERRDGDEIWGKVEWLDYLLIVPLPEVDDITSASFDALAASV
ncbi:hypothetical protein AALP_AA7G274300 [Arabis alpina]|uniref:FKB95-like N-terminal Kelch domain-containing protein n=1 Tax=Arabis alpina TaxID=50452 RepID=A0A087GKX7_ARAAL|nr:hypothetical protein AALP_AA7G274300 [Arabis alpina]